MVRVRATPALGIVQQVGSGVDIEVHDAAQKEDCSGTP